MTPSPLGGCNPSHYGSGEIAVTTTSGEARQHRIARFSLAVRQGSFHDAGPEGPRKNYCTVGGCKPSRYGVAEIAVTQ